MRRTFPTSGPTSAYVEIGSGLVEVHATETHETEVQVDGYGAEEVVVEQRGEQIVVIGPQQRLGFLGSGGGLTVTVHLPLDSELATRLGSADLATSGRLGTARIKSGSGDVRAEEFSRDAVIQTGSGDVEVGRARSDLRVKTGSGHVQVGTVSASAVVVSGSGRITVESAEEDTVTKSGSGDIRLGNVSNHVSMTSSSGDLEVDTIRKGVMKANSASGDVRVGVPAGIPVWTDISTVSGSVRSNLEGAGRPEDGQDFIEIRATTVSGDVNLSQL